MLTGKTTGKRTWSTIDEKVLLGFHKSGTTAIELVDTFNKTEQSINKKANRMGVKLGKYKKD